MRRLSYITPKGTPYICSLGLDLQGLLATVIAAREETPAGLHQYEAVTGKNRVRGSTGSVSMG